MRWLLDFLDWLATPYSYYLYVDARMKALEAQLLESRRFHRARFEEQRRRGIQKFEQRLKEARK